MWKSVAEDVGDPKLMTIDVKPLGPSAEREIGTFSLKTKGQTQRTRLENMLWFGKGLDMIGPRSSAAS